MANKLTSRIHKILNEYYDGNHLPNNYCISEIADIGGQTHHLLHRNDKESAFYDISDTQFYNKFLNYKLSTADITKIETDSEIPKYSKDNQQAFINLFGEDSAEKLREDFLHNKCSFGRFSDKKSNRDKTSTIKKIREKFDIDKSQKITIRYLDNGYVKLKIGNEVAVGDKTKFNNFVHQPQVKTFGAITFKKFTPKEELIRKKFDINPEDEINITHLRNGDVRLRIGDKETIGSKTQFKNFVYYPTVKSFGDISFVSQDGIKASTKKEIDIANAVDDWIKKDKQNPVNPNIDDVLDGDNREDHFYAVRDGSPTKSDVLVVHDKRKYNPDSKKPKSPDRDFYIEAKLSEQARSFNPALHIVGNKHEVKFKYSGFFVDNNDKQVKQVSENLSEEEQAQERSENVILGDEITKLVEQTPQSMKILSILDEMLNLYNGRDASTGGEYEFPKDFVVFPKIFDSKLEHSMQNGDREYLDDMLEIFNEKYKSKINTAEQLKGISDNQKITMLVYFAAKKVTGRPTLDIFRGKLPEAKLGDLVHLITWWYRTKKDVAYIEIGPSDKHSGGVYIFDQDFDTLNLQEKFKGRISIYAESIRGASYVIRRLHNKKANGFVINFKLKIEENGLQFENILSGDKNDTLKMEPGDTKNDDSEFFNPRK